MPNTASQKNSKAPNSSANSASTGAMVARNKIPISVPRTDPVVAMPMARPASPRRASGKPSSVVAALAGVPGMLSRMALREPP